MSVVAFFSDPWAQRLGWVLIHFLWQGMGVALLLAIALSFLSRASSHVRYVVIAGALLLCGALPVATWTLLDPPAQPVAFSEPPLPFALAAPSAAPAPSDLYPKTTMERPAAVPEQWQAGLAQLANVALPEVVGLWLAGVLVLTLRLTLVWMSMRRLCLSGLAIRDTPCLERFRALRERMRIGVPVRLLQSALVEVPMLIGWLRPTILVPASVFIGLTPGQLDAILAHELAHVRRYDYLVNLFQTALETILFYHPAVWWISLKLREERENCCDDIALEVMQDRLIYASALARLEEGRALPFALTASGGSLLQRIRRIAGANDRKVSALPLGIVVLILMAAIGISIQTARSDAPAVAITPQAKDSASNSLPALDVRVTISLSGKLKDWTKQSTDKHGWIGTPVSHIDLAPVGLRFGEKGIIEEVRIFPYPIDFDAVETVEKTDDNNQSLKYVVPITPTEFKTENIGWRVTVTVEKGKNGIIKVQGIANCTTAALSHGAYGENSGPIYKDIKDPQTGTVDHALISKNESSMPIFQTSVTPFFVFAKPGQPYNVNLQSGSDSIDATIQCDLLEKSPSPLSKKTTDASQPAGIDDMPRGKSDPNAPQGNMSETKAKRRGIAAVVNGKPIFWSDSKNYSLPIEYCIDRELQIQSAKALGYSTPQIILDKRIDYNVKNFGGDRNAFVQNLNKNGISLEQFLDRVRGDDMSEHMFALNVDEPAKKYIQSLHLSKPSTSTEQEKKREEALFQEKATQLSSAWMQDLRSKAAIQRFEDAKASNENFHIEPSSPKTAFTFDSSNQDNGEPLTVRTFLSPNDFFHARWRDTVDLKRELIAHGIEFPREATIFYLPTSNKLVVRDTPEQLDKISTLLENFLQEKTQPQSHMPQNHVMEKPSEKLQAPDSLKQDINFAFLNPCDESPGILDVDFSYRADISLLLRPLKDRHLVPILPVLSSPRCPTLPKR